MFYNVREKDQIERDGPYLGVEDDNTTVYVIREAVTGVVRESREGGKAS